MAQSAERPPLAEPRALARAENPFAGELVRATGANVGGLVSVEQQRAIAEVQARMIIARANPRDPVRAMDRILNDCTRPTLAEKAVFEYARGGTKITGPTIRLAEAIAQRWGNIASGIREIARHDDHSECIAYAWDLESGFYDERQFQIRHWRDRSEEHGGGYRLTDERDIYELIANFGQRRKRAVLLTVIPGDVTEAALQQCEQTMTAKADVTPEGVRKLVEAFAALGVEPAQIEARIQRHVDAIRPAQVVMLRKIYNSISDGMSEPGDWFGAGAVASEPAAETSDPKPERQPQGRRGRGRQQRQQSPPPPSTGEPAGKPATTAGPQQQAGPAQQQQPSPQQQRRVNFEV